MEQFFYQTYMIALPIVLTSLMGWIVWLLKKQKKDRDANSKGTMLLLRVQLIEYHDKYMMLGDIPSYAYENFMEMYDAYHAFYDTYHKNMEKMAEEYGKTSVQKKYLEKKYNEIKLPVEYESYSSWDTMIMYVETYSIILAIIVGFICAGIFADDFQTKADAVFFSTKYGRTKAVKTKILAGIATTVMIYCMGIILLSVICFGIMGTSGMDTPYQMYQAYSIYIMSYGQYYLLTVVCGFIASMLAASVSMLVAAKMHTISVAVCIPFFLYCLLPFIGRALSGYTTLFNLIPTILTNVQASVKVPLIYQIGNCVFRQIPLVMVMYTVMAIALLPFIYKSFRRYGNR